MEHLLVNQNIINLFHGVGVPSFNYKPEWHIVVISSVNYYKQLSVDKKTNHYMFLYTSIILSDYDLLCQILHFI